MASYYAGAGDGYVKDYEFPSNWSTVHGRSSGTSYDYTGTTAKVASDKNSSIFFTIDRAFLPIDTSGIDDSATIISALLYIYVTSKIPESANNPDNDGNDWLNIVQTSQASYSALVADDFDQCGAVTNPTEGATRVDISSGITPLQYNSFTLNSTGIGWIDKVNANATKLGLREGHDALNDEPADGSDTGIVFSTSEDTSGVKDPYLDITTGSGVSPVSTGDVHERAVCSEVYV